MRGSLACRVLLLSLALRISNAGRSHRTNWNMRPRRQLPGYFAPSSGRGPGWGPWSQWGDCSRSCGGGVSIQTRTCYRGSQSNSRFDSKCSGPYKKYRSCNLIACPGSRDVLADKCATHNNEKFSGQSYEWEPFSTGNYCQLNCRAKGHRFYVRHSTKDTDGIGCTPTPPPPGRSKHICINGRCLKVGCDGNVNSGLTIDRCGVCGGNGASCEVVEGLFRRETLNLGYNFVVAIPAGATRINITEMSASMNYLALNSSDPNGRNYVNGEWGAPEKPKIYNLPGTYVDYKRPLRSEKGESMIIPGPTTESMDVWLFFQRNNPGIYYEYTIPKHSPEFDQALSPSDAHNSAGDTTTVGRPRVQNPLLDVNGHALDTPAGGRDTTQYQPHGPAQVSPNIYSHTRGSRYYNTPYMPTGGSRYRHPLHPANRGRNTYNRYQGGLNMYPNLNGQGVIRPPVAQNPVNRVHSNTGHSTIDAPSDTNPAREPANPRREVSVVNIQPEQVDTRGNQAVETIIRASDLDKDVPVPAARRVKWSREGFSQCSKSCAEGRQTVLIKCVDRETRNTVDDRLCNNLARPSLIVRKCNRAPCPAFYEVSPWSECSKTCGNGRRSRRVLCRQQFPGNFTSTVNPKRCRKLERPIAHEQCLLKECAKWTINSDWSECNVQCGTGKQTREVLCATSDGTTLPNSQCTGTRPPSAIRMCKMPQCITSYFITDWGTCSADCDTGVQRRDVRCMNTAGLAQGCSGLTKPADTRDCASASCGDKYEWFTGAWGPCSNDCGTGTQDRRVTCMILSADGGMRIADSRDLCSSEEQPTTQQSCNTQSCGSRWYYTTWSECTATCGGGTRDREVWCLDAEGKTSTSCKDSEKPIYQERCNTEDCSVLIDPECNDLFRSCRMVLQARLCSYPYYKRNCCRTCSQPTPTERTNRRWGG